MTVLVTPGYVGSAALDRDHQPYSEAFGIPIHHHLPFWWDVAAIAVFSLAVFYYAVHSRLSPERTAVNGGEAVAGTEQEELTLEVEPA